VSSSKEKLSDGLANLLNETAEAHHKAFAATNGEAYLICQLLVR
jgi:hypothetical protein